MSSVSLLKSRYFLPLFITQWGGALNDNLYRTALISFVTFNNTDVFGFDPTVYAAIAGVVFMLPFFLLSAFAGQLADAYDKTVITRGVKIFEVFIMLLAVYVLSSPSSPGLDLSVVFLLGVHSAFFGPIKYAILPQHIAQDDLLAANGLIELGTFIAILLGVMLGVILAPIYSSYVGVILSLVGVVSAWRMPAAPSLQKQPIISLNVLKETYILLRTVVRDKALALPIIAISWIWALGSVILGQMQAYTRLYLNGDQTAAAIPLIVFTLGIGAGSLGIVRVLKGRASLRYSVLSGIGMSLFLIDFYWATFAFERLPTSGWVGPLSVMRSDGIGRILLDLFGIAACAGAFVVPMYAILQMYSEPDQRARIIAANNIINAAFIIFWGGILALALFGLGMTLPFVFVVFALINLILIGFLHIVMGKQSSQLG